MGTSARNAKLLKAYAEDSYHTERYDFWIKIIPNNNFSSHFDNLFLSLWSLMFFPSSIISSPVAEISSKFILIIFSYISIGPTLLLFVLFNLLPKGFRRKYLNANRRRYAHSIWWHHRKGYICHPRLEKECPSIENIGNMDLVSPLGQWNTYISHKFNDTTSVPCKLSNDTIYFILDRHRSAK